jgi:arylsulfatase A-like enzyme
MMRCISLCLAVWLSGFCLAAADRPNMVFILADDLGWADTTLYGQTSFYRTPNIERLAKRGMTFSRAYAASPLCSPTRASILTGLNPARIGITAPNCHLARVVLKASLPAKGGAGSKVRMPDSVTRFDTKYETLAERLKAAGLATGHFGKWHLGAEPYSPLEHGFDVDIPHWPGPGPAGSFVAPWKYPDFDPQTPNEHIEDRMAQEAVAFMEKWSAEKVPFFLNYWMFSVHAPFDAKKALIEKYRGEIDPTNPQRSPTYAAMVESMDDAVGTLLDTLDRLKIADNTVVVFFSDNGGNMYNEVDGTTPTSNAPLRGGKATMFEGGVRVPMVVAWPGMVAAGSRSDVMVQSCDFYPTIMEMLGMTGGKYDGVSILPALKGGTIEREAIFTFFPHSPGVPDTLPPAVSVHRGDWKLIRVFHDRDMLFNLREDNGEKNDLSASRPDLVKELNGLIDDFLTDTEAVVPLPNPAYNAVPKGWVANKDCTVEMKDGVTVLKSTGGDPSITSTLPKSLAPGNYVVEIKMVSSAKGAAQLFWKARGKPMHRDRSVVFQPVADGEKRHYRLEFAAAGKFDAIRLDPAAGEGEVLIYSVMLRSAEGKVVWESE